MKPLLHGSLLCALLLSTGAAGADNSTLVGTVLDGESGRPLADVMVVITAPEVDGDRVVVTDARGHYSLPRLPAGRYTLRFEKDRYKPSTRADLQLRPNRTIRYDVKLFSTSSVHCDRKPEPAREE